MNNEVIELFDRYKTLHKNYQILLKKRKLEEIEIADFLNETVSSDLEKHRELCAEALVEMLEKEPKPQLAYSEWISSAANGSDFYLLDILLCVKTKFGYIDYSNTDLFLLKYLFEFFENFHDDEKENYAKYLFEQLIDVQENDLDIFSELLERIFSLSKAPKWFDNFYDQIMKLVTRAPVNQRTISAVKMGLSITTTPDIKEFLEEYLEFIKLP